MGVTWDAGKISTLLLRGFAPCPDRPNIDVLVTFDKDGVSAHSNHISLYHGACEFIAQLARSAAVARGIDLADKMMDPAAPAPPIDLYTLTSVNVLRKYSGILDVFATMAGGLRRLAPVKVVQVAKDQILAKTKGDDEDDDDDDYQVPKKDEIVAPKPDNLIFALPLTGARGAAFARAPMLQAHVSQMVWFRYGWIYLSRYMVLNSLRRETVTVAVVSASADS